MSPDGKPIVHISPQVINIVLLQFDVLLLGPLANSTSLE